MKNLLIITIVAVLLCGCNQNQQSGLKTALGDALTIGHEIEKIEREACLQTIPQSGSIYDSKVIVQIDCPVADKIAVWLEAGQKIYDTGSYDDNCDLMQSVADIAYEWVSEQYPDKPYRIYLALLKIRLAGYCGDTTK